MSFTTPRRRPLPAGDSPVKSDLTGSSLPLTPTVLDVCLSLPPCLVNFPNK